MRMRVSAVHMAVIIKSAKSVQRVEAVACSTCMGGAHGNGRKGLLKLLKQLSLSIHHLQAIA